MKKEDFNNLVKSINQAGQIKKGQLAPSRKIEFSPLDLKAIRGTNCKNLKVNLGVSVSTLQNWA